MKINNVLIKPIVTEKAINLYNQEGCYTFEVDLSADRGDIKRALQNAFDVEPYEIRTWVMPGKRRRVPNTSEFRTGPMKKKAIFKLKKGKLDIYAGE